MIGSIFTSWRPYGDDRGKRLHKGVKSIIVLVFCTSFSCMVARGGRAAHCCVLVAGARVAGRGKEHCRFRPKSRCKVWAWGFATALICKVRQLKNEAYDANQATPAAIISCCRMTRNVYQNQKPISGTQRSCAWFRWSLPTRNGEEARRRLPDTKQRAGVLQCVAFRGPGMRKLPPAQIEQAL